ncbi:MAG: FAD-binding oxidoreductase, partial [Deltaproteobacteria bacterium]|nr:FAD-binding oxidoreductase [Deltaproteobacteria bacterium]
FEKTRVLNPEPTPSVLRGIRRNLDAMFPQLADTPIVESWAGMIESSPDVIPIIDVIDSLPGFHVATGFSGHGFGIGPGAGKAIAGMLMGKETGIDISEFRLSRFFDGSPIRPQASIWARWPGTRIVTMPRPRLEFVTVRLWRVSAKPSGWKSAWAHRS